MSIAAVLAGVPIYPLAALYSFGRSPGRGGRQSRTAAQS
jgi:hypothetical protein